MDIKDKLTDETRMQLSGCLIEVQVLNNLLTERKEKLNAMVGAVMKSLNLSPTLYMLEMNPSKNVWNAVLKPGQLVVPGDKTVEALKNQSPFN